MLKKEYIINSYLRQMVTAGASDFFITVDCPPSMKIEGKIVALDAPPLDEGEIKVLVDDLLNEDQQDEFHSTLELNTAIALEGGERFRISMFKQKHSTGIVVRLIKTNIPSFEDLGIPQIYKKFIMRKRGLFLLVGATGSGKSTSMAVMLDYKNTNDSGHILTIEDPIEYVHQHKACIFTQREIGVDTYSYGIALKNALRQSPDVVVIGEIRDRETMENALLFCETGHLVVATLHANNSSQAIERIVNLFPEELHKQTLTTLSQNLVGIASQRLVEGTSGSLALAYDILINEGLAKHLIEEGNIKDLKEAQKKNIDQGMITFDQCLFGMIKSGEITYDVAMREADNPSNLRLEINQERTLGATEKSADNITQVYKDISQNESSQGGTLSEPDF